jgi:hypothetical protein
MRILKPVYWGISATDAVTKQRYQALTEINGNIYEDPAIIFASSTAVVNN